MDGDFEIKINANGKPYQTFNGRKFTLHNGKRYFTNGPMHMHWYVWEHFNVKREKGYHIHHKDGNSWNNQIDNLEQVKVCNHLSEHSKNRIKSNPEKFKEFYSKGIESAKEWHRSEEGREWHRAKAIAQQFGKPLSIESKCKHCGIDYIAKTKHSKFCHPNCKAKALRLRYKLEGKSLRPNNRRST